MHQLDFVTRYAYPPSDRGIEVPIELRYGGESVRLPAKIDTGASGCFFQRAYAEELGVDVEAGRLETFSTAAGVFEAYGHRVEIDCLGHRNYATVYFARAISFSRNVLGRDGWLDHHRMGLSDRESLLYLSSNFGIGS
jgi:Aspartyl protease